MRKRMSRAEQTGRNRALVLAAARRVFLARGYHAASVDQIADEAGFSKGVVYSQFDGKADMFLALLEDRITERAAQNAHLAAEVAGTGDFTRLLDGAMRAEQAAPGWRLLVTEFRVLAARDPELNKRYAAVHARTVDGVASLLAAIAEGAAGPLPLPPRPLAELLLGLEAGLALEQVANPDALGGRHVADMLASLQGWLASGAASGVARGAARTRSQP
jgi:AcrR family transcriptional regulator